MMKAVLNPWSDLNLSSPGYNEVTTCQGIDKKVKGNAWQVIWNVLIPAMSRCNEPNKVVYLLLAWARNLGK